MWAKLKMVGIWKWKHLIIHFIDRLMTYVSYRWNCLGYDIQGSIHKCNLHTCWSQQNRCNLCWQDIHHQYYMVDIQCCCWKSWIQNHKHKSCWYSCYVSQHHCNQSRRCMFGPQFFFCHMMYYIEWLGNPTDKSIFPDNIHCWIQQQNSPSQPGKYHLLFLGHTCYCLPVIGIQYYIGMSHQSIHYC